MCNTNYIGIDRSTTSRTGLYIVDLPGVEVNLLADLTTPDQANYLEFWNVIYARAWNNLISNVTDKLNGKFFIDAKLISRETSKFQESYNTGSEAGIRLDFDLPKYAKLHIVSIGVMAESSASSPDFELNFYDTDSSGELLHTVNEDIEAGRNTINIDTDFEVSSLLVVYNADLVSLKKTENKYFPGSSTFNKVYCTIPCSFGEAGVTQVGGGGLNVKFNVVCSVLKFVCENINIFKYAFLYKIGLEILNDRIYGNTVNCFTAMTPERATELKDFYTQEYDDRINAAMSGLNIYEDPFCFNCKNTVTAKTILP